MLGVLIGFTFLYGELSGFLELLFGWNPIPLELLFDHFVLDEPLSLLEVIHGVDDLGISGHSFLLDIKLLRPSPILSPCYTSPNAYLIRIPCW